MAEAHRSTVEAHRSTVETHRSTVEAHSSTVGGGSDSLWSLLTGGMWWEACADTVFTAAAIVGCKKAAIVPSGCKNAVIVGCKKAEGSFTVRDQWQSQRL